MSARVLVVDDVLPNVKLLAAKLTREYFDVVTASSGPEALERARSQSPDIILLDVNMPDMDGYETMRVIRLRPEFRTLPIIALTAKAMKGDREKCLDAGASDYIAKPVNTEQLLSLLRVWLYR